jgi:hypothetical protein
MLRSCRPCSCTPWNWSQQAKVLHSSLLMFYLFPVFHPISNRSVSTSEGIET